MDEGIRMQPSVCPLHCGKSKIAMLKLKRKYYGLLHAIQLKRKEMPCASTSGRYKIYIVNKLFNNKS